MTSIVLEMSVPREGTINGRSIGIYTTDAHNGHVLIMFEDAPGSENGAIELMQWDLPPSPGHEPVRIAQELLHDDAERRLIKAGVLRRTRQ